MHFLTYRRQDEERVAVLSGDGCTAIDLIAGSEAIGVSSAPATMLELVGVGEEAVRLAERLLEQRERLPAAALFDADGLVVAPLPKPGKNIFAVGLNYVRHTREFTGSDRLPENPIIFTKAPTAVIGTGVPIELRPDLSSQVDYEGELGVVIGKRGRDISREQAEEFIFGYTIINDVTARDLQKRTSQWFMGKSLDTFCPMGPHLVHKSAVGWPVKLDVRTLVNGEVRQESNTKLLYFDIGTLIATISAGVTLEPGDIIATGTPEGVGMGFDPPKFLQSGDLVEIEIEKLGTLRNPVR